MQWEYIEMTKKDVYIYLETKQKEHIKDAKKDNDCLARHKL